MPRLILHSIPLLLAVVVGLFTIDGGFVRDDTVAIETNAIVTEARGVVPTIGKALASDFWGTPLTKEILVYRPLTPIIWNFLWQAWGGSPFPFRLFTLILHVVATGLVIVLGRHLLKENWAPLIGGAFFAVHPLHTEALGGIVSQADMLAAIFGLSAVLLLVRAAGSGHSFSCRPLVVALLFGIACLAKESAIIFAPILIVLPFLQGGRSNGWRWAHAGPVFVLAVGIVVFQLQLERVPRGGEVFAVVTDAETFSEIILAGLYVIGRGVQLCFFPLNLSPSFHDYAEVDLALTTLLPYSIPGLLFLGGGGWLLYVSIRQGRPAWFVLLGLLFGPILLQTNVVTFPTAFAERVLYTSTVASCLVVAYVVSTMVSRRYLQFLVVILAVSGLLVQSYRYQRPWRDGFQLFRFAVQTAPLSLQANTGYCLYLFRRGEVFEGAWYYLVYKYIQIMHLQKGRRHDFADPMLLLRQDRFSEEDASKEARIKKRLLAAPKVLSAHDPCFLLYHFLAGMSQSFPAQARTIAPLFSEDESYRQCFAVERQTKAP